MSDSLKYDASDMSEAENEIRYWIIYYIIIIDDFVWTEIFVDDIFKCIENVLNANCFLLVDFLSFLLSEFIWEWDMFI